MITEEMIRRINELARKNKETGLTPEETAERDILRKQYIEAFRTNLKAQLDNIDFVDEDGTIVKPGGIKVDVRRKSN